MISRLTTDKCPGCGGRFRASPYNTEATEGSLLATHLTGRIFCARDHYDLGKCILWQSQYLIPDTLHAVGLVGWYEVIAVDKEGRRIVVAKCDSRAATARVISKLKSCERVNLPRPAWRG